MKNCFSGCSLLSVIVRHTRAAACGVPLEADLRDASCGPPPPPGCGPHGPDGPIPTRDKPAAERWACTSGPAGREDAALRPGAAAGCRSLRTVTILRPADPCGIDPAECRSTPQIKKYRPERGRYDFGKNGSAGQGRKAPPRALPHYSAGAAVSGSATRMRPQYSQTMIFLPSRISAWRWGGMWLKQPPQASRLTVTTAKPLRTLLRMRL